MNEKGKLEFGYDLAAREIMGVGDGRLCYQDNRAAAGMKTAGHFRFWDGRQWAIYKENWLQKLITRVFERQVRKEQARKEIVRHLMIHLGVERDQFDAKAHLLFLQDCVLDSVTLAVRPHEPADCNTFVIPIRYDPRATCPRWRQCLNDWIGRYDNGGAWVTDEETVRVLQEYIGYVLQVSCKFDKFLLLKGYGSNGKSAFIQTVADMLGPLAVAFAFSDFGDRFAVGELEGKLLAYTPDEVGTMSGRIDSSIKSFASGETLRSEQKFVQAHNFRNTAKGLWACNNAPRFADFSHGNARRVMAVPFNRNFDREAADLKLDRDQLLQDLRAENCGILNWAIEGLWRLLGQGSFTVAGMVKTATSELLEHHDPLREFLSKCYVVGRAAQTEFAAIYQRYVLWCDERGVQRREQIAERKFSEEVCRREPSVTKKRVGAGVFLQGIRPV
jgi:putative DNA primase/helicase